MAFGFGNLGVTACLRGEKDRQEKPKPDVDQHGHEDDRRDYLAPNRDLDVKVLLAHDTASGMTRSTMKSASLRTASPSPPRAASSSACAVRCASSTMICAR